jgi:hypothetical protein
LLPVTESQPVNSKQLIFRDWTLGTLIYAVVMGFFDDYTDFLTTDSFSTLFLAALVMQALTFATFQFKKRVGTWFRGRPEGTGTKVAHGLSIWAILFFSKFIFLEVIDFTFGDAVEISSFVGLMVIIAVMVIASRLIDAIDQWLAADAQPAATK